jgi:hypothetical protein
MKRGLLYIGVVLSFFSCNEEGAEMDDFRAAVYLELSNEAELHLLSESWSGANKYRTENKRRNFAGLDNYHAKLDTVFDLYETCKVHLMDSVYLSHFERDYLTLRFNYKTLKGTYSYPINSEDLSTMNPDDTADFARDKALLNQILNLDLSEGLRKLHLIELTNQCLNYHSNQISWGFYFYTLELLVNSPQNIWIKGEKGYFVADYYCTDGQNDTKVKIGNQIFDDEPTIIAAPFEKGLQEINGVYYMKEAGIEVAKPFTYRVWVE